MALGRALGSGLGSGRSGWIELRRRGAVVVVTVLALGGLYLAAGHAVHGMTGFGERRHPMTLAADHDGTTSIAVSLSHLEPLAGTDGTWQSMELSTSSFTMAALTWRGPDVGLRLRTHGAGGWTPWQDLVRLGDGPDHGVGEGHPGLRATDLQWTGSSDGAQVQVTGGVPANLRLTLIGTPTSSDARLAATTSPAAGDDLRPALVGRAGWGADPALRSGRPVYDRTLQQVQVHGTVASNAYTPADVPGLIRGLYRYDTETLGWSDLGANFLVDRFGRIFVGRAGGADKPVRGAHTPGFNGTSTGVAVIGDFEHARPGTRVLDALARLAAWKLQPYDRDARGTVSVWSHGSDRFPRGRVVALPVIDGHPDTSAAAVPARYLYAALPAVRRRVAATLAPAAATGR